MSMSSTNNETERKATRKMLPIWRRRENELLSYKQIVEETKKRELSERTTVRYLNLLVGAEVLEREERGYKKTFYKPNAAKWELLMKPASVRVVNDQEEFFWNNLRDVIAEKFEKTIFRYETKGQSEIDCSKSQLSPQNTEKLKSLTKSMISSLNSSLTYKYLDGKNNPYTVYDLLTNNLLDFISSQMELWSFIAETPGAAEEFKKQIDKCLKRQ